MTRKWPLVGVALAALWLFVRGVSADDVVGEAVIGLGVGLALAYGLRAFYTERVSVRARLAALPYVVRYVAVFLRELVTANVEVAYRVLSPRLPIEPAVVAVPLRVESDAAVTTIANSITLTPGTLTMDHDAASNTLYVHALVGDASAVIEPIRTLEDYAIRIFDEDATPADPAPPARTGDSLADGNRGERRE